MAVFRKALYENDAIKGNLTFVATDRQYEHSEISDLTAVIMKIFWDVALCSLVKVIQKHCVHQQGNN
jgi:hypothetical protein